MIKLFSLLLLACFSYTAIADDFEVVDAKLKAAMQADLDRIRTVVADYPMIPALKAVVAHYAGDPSWRRVRRRAVH